jgi:hypothetical protein
MVSFTGLGQGIERGIRLGIAMDENERRKQESADMKKTREQNQLLTQMQIDSLNDQNERQKALRSINETLYHLASIKSNPKEYVKRLQADPESAAVADESINTVGQMLVDSRGIDDGLKREFAGFTPTPDGRMMVNLRVTRPDGTVYEPPLTENGSTDPNDPVLAFTIDDLGQLTSALNSEIQRLESRAVGLGDTSPMQRRQAGIARNQDIADKKDMLKYEYGLKTGLEKEKAKAKKGISGLGDSTKAKHQAELEAQDIPREAARAIAYGTARPIKDEYGMTTALVDISTGKTMGSLAEDDDGNMKYVPNPEWSKKGQGVGIGGAGTESASKGRNTYQGTVNGKTIQFTDSDIEETAKKYGLTVEAVRRQLNITEN